ncbi:Dihydrolipoyl dehydrogenase (Dihydrolipoamide dehydrogenase) [Durusdinium trenchii]|uniref:Dihydrolipoyl dehydrogenase (Dihydrolipoamide dehydrogenase) n=1 Tax=Durusdinium trenchii TaxID=1381693 RepID=A0ABP0HSW0_9DINO
MAPHPVPHHYEFDLAVIGAGSAGLSAAGFAAQMGASVLLVDKKEPGGDCTWSGCVPSKALVHLASEQAVLGKSADLKRIQESVQATIRRVYQHEDPAALEEKGIEFAQGEVEFLDKYHINVRSAEDGKNRNVSSRNFLVATGAKPVYPESITGFDAIDNKYNYETIWELTKLPQRLIVVGSGPVGCELAQAFARLGSQVTLVGSTLLPRETKRARETVLKALEKDGISFLHSRPAAATQNAGGVVNMVMSDGTKAAGDAVLYAVGRAPVLPAGLAKVVGAGSIAEDGGLICSDTLAVKSCPNIYGAGDCVEENLQFTHYAGYQGFQAVRNALLPFSSEAKIPASVPRVTFTDPEVGAIGLNTLVDAQHHGFKSAVVLRWSGAHTDRAVCQGAEDVTFVELVVANATSPHAKIIGANAVGPSAGELICELSLIVSCGLTLSQVSHAIHPYPTYGFAIQQLCAEETTTRLLKTNTLRLLTAKYKSPCCTIS